MNEITYTQIMPNDIDDVIRIERATFSENEALSVESMIERINLIPDSFIAARNSEGNCRRLRFWSCYRRSLLG